MVYGFMNKSFIFDENFQIDIIKSFYLLPNEAKKPKTKKKL